MPLGSSTGLRYHVFSHARTAPKRLFQNGYGWYRLYTSCKHAASQASLHECRRPVVRSRSSHNGHQDTATPAHSAHRSRLPCIIPVKEVSLSPRRFTSRLWTSTPLKSKKAPWSRSGTSTNRSAYRVWLCVFTLLCASLGYHQECNRQPAQPQANHQDRQDHRKDRLPTNTSVRSDRLRGGRRQAKSAIICTSGQRDRCQHQG